MSHIETVQRFDSQSSSLQANMSETIGESLLSETRRLLEEAKLDDSKMEEIKQEYAKGGVTVQQEKSKFLKIKYVLMETEARHAFLQKMMLDPEQWQHNEGPPLEEICSQLKSAKEEKDAIKEEISQSIELSLQANAKLQGEIQELEKLMEELIQAKDKLESMKEKMRNMQSSGRNVKEQLIAQKVDLSRLEDSLKSTQECLESAKQERDRIKMSGEKLKQDIAQSTEILNSQSQKIQSGLNAEFSRVERALEMINKLDGITLDVHHMDRTTLVIEFSNTINHVPQPSLFANIQYTMGADDNMHIKSATVNLDCFSVEDLVETEKHCVPSFIHKVLKRWQDIKQPEKS